MTKSELKENVEVKKSDDDQKRNWTEEIEVKGEQLVKKVKKLAAESHVKRSRVIEPDGDIALDIPLAYGAIAGGAVVIAASVLAVIGALAAFVSKVKIEFIHEGEKDKAA